MAFLLFERIIVLFLMMAMGFAVVKIGFLKSADSKILSTVCLYVVVPCMQIQAFQVHYSDTIRDGFLLALFAAVIIHAILFALVYGMDPFLHLSDEERGSLIYSNAGNLIVPLVTSVLGKNWIIYASGFMFVQAILLWSHGKWMMQGGGRVHLKDLLVNINIIATLVGAALFFLKIEIHGIVGDTIYDVSQMIGPISMISIGMILAGVDWHKVFANRRIYLITILKMLVLPGIILCVLKFSPLHTLVKNGRMILFVSLLAVVAPSGATIPQMAQIYDRDADYASAINIFTTLVCIITMPVMALIYEL